MNHLVERMLSRAGFKKQQDAPQIEAANPSNSFAGSRTNSHMSIGKVMDEESSDIDEICTSELYRTMRLERALASTGRQMSEEQVEEDSSIRVYKR
mmetsp:Transcript_10043/g.19811  ORF Transcript_10043/g.19811 Transcript_10043/m.19811 type:complete len:96 (-) Transcript_10043:19-306(-)